MENVDISALDLATVAGAGAVAFIVAQFCKALFNLAPKWVRVVAMLTGLAVVVVVSVFGATEVSPVQIIMAVVVGMQAGLSAQALFDNARAGLDHSVVEAGTDFDEAQGA